MIQRDAYPLRSWLERYGFASTRHCFHDVVSMYMINGSLISPFCALKHKLDIGDGYRFAISTLCSPSLWILSSYKNIRFVVYTIGTATEIKKVFCNWVCT
jgi:hypothetical protein